MQYYLMHYDNCIGRYKAAAGTAVYIELGTVRDINCSLSCLTRIYAGLASEWRGEDLSRLF